LVLASALAGVAFGQTANRSYYVRADGNDNNNGRSETAPLKTLQKALSLSSQGAVKTITVIGKIEGGVINDIQVSTDAEIFITGKVDASDEEKAVLGALSIRGNKIHFRFENIAIIGDYYGKALAISGASIKIGAGVKISSQKDNDSNGILLDMGATFVMDDGEISGNTRSGVSIMNRCTFTMNGGIISQNGHGKLDRGGGISNMGTVVINGGTITNNTAKNGGGILNYGTLTINDGSITQNKAEYGAGIYQDRGKLTIEKGSITANEAEFVGGGLYVKKGASFTQKGNVISGNSAGDGEGEDIFSQQ
jgi:hypothetical protein